MPSNPEDIKIIGLARAARARSGVEQGAAVRDTDGRTYAASTVTLPSLQLSAVAVAVAMALCSGAPGLEAVAVCGGQGPSEHDRVVAGELPGAGVVIWWTDPAGVVQDVIDVHG